MLQFDEATHTYTKGIQQYIPVTVLLKQFNLSADYTNIPKDILRKAADRGKAVHKELENFIKYGTPGTSTEYENFSKYISARNIDLTQALSEDMVHDDTYYIAGTIDFQYVDGDEKVLADFKTTSSIHWNSVAWQLSIYNYMKCNGDVLSYYMTTLKVFHLYGGRLHVRTVPTIDYDEVVKLFEAYKNNLPYVYTPDVSKIISDSEGVVLERLLSEISDCEALLQELQQKKEVLQNKIQDNMKNTNVHEVTIGNLKIKYIDGTVRKTIDTDLLKQMCENLNIDINSLYKSTTSKARLNINKVR